MNNATGDTGGITDNDNCEAPHAIERSISPDVPCPETVLVALMSDGSYVLMSFPQREPVAFVVREDADPLRQALQGAFARTGVARASLRRG